MRVAYCEMIGGASGNMLLGAFLDAGLEREKLENALRTIPVGEWTLEAGRVRKASIAAIYCDFAINDDSTARSLKDVGAILDASGLSASQKERAGAVYRRLAAAEAKVHGESLERVHFHEVGAIDAILDVAASVVALDLLDVKRLFCSPFPLGNGEIAMRHGTYPNPPPASAELMRGFPTRSTSVQGEMVTTTAAAILATIAEEPGTRPSLRVDAIGYGAGKADFSVPNVVRVSIGELLDENAAVQRDSVLLLEANIDDMSPEYYELAIERLFAAGALDVWMAAIVMKRSRPGTILSALVPTGSEERCAEVMLGETATLGVRMTPMRRLTLTRELNTLESAYGAIRYKSVRTPEGHARHTLEYEDVLRIAREHRRPIGEVAAELERLLP